MPDLMDKLSITQAPSMPTSLFGIPHDTFVSSVIVIFSIALCWGVLHHRIVPRSLSQNQYFTKGIIAEISGSVNVCAAPNTLQYHYVFRRIASKIAFAPNSTATTGMRSLAA